MRFLKGVSTGNCPFSRTGGLYQKEFHLPKMKRHSGAAKRLRQRKSGSIRRSKAAASHNLSKKSSKRKMDLRQSTDVHKADLKRVRRMLAS